MENDKITTILKLIYSFFRFLSLPYYLLMLWIYPKYKDYEEYITGGFTFMLFLFLSTLFKANTSTAVFLNYTLISCGIGLSYLFIVHGKKYKS